LEFVLKKIQCRTLNDDGDDDDSELGHWQLSGSKFLHQPYGKKHCSYSNIEQTCELWEQVDMFSLMNPYLLAKLVCNLFKIQSKILTDEITNIGILDSGREIDVSNKNSITISLDIQTQNVAIISI